MREWLDEEAGPDATGLALSGADLPRPYALAADFSRADLTGASPVRGELDDAALREAVLDGADLAKASWCEVVASRSFLTPAERVKKGDPMGLLLRAPEECASWFWDLEHYGPPGLRSALKMAARMVAVLRKHGLLEPRGLEFPWFIPGAGGAPASTRLHLLRSLDDEQVFQRVQDMRPVGFPEAEMGDVLVAGAGVWVDENGARRSEYRLVELTVSPERLGLSAEVSVHHDIWGSCDFRGTPRPEVQQQNAPRLAAALKDLDDLLGTVAEPGEATYFGVAEGYGVAEPMMVDGRGPHLTDRL